MEAARERERDSKTRKYEDKHRGRPEERATLVLDGGR